MAVTPYRRDARRAFWIALALLLCVTGAVLEESFAHTDDGCAVEVHCVACRWASAAIGVSPQVAAPATIFVAVAGVAPPIIPDRADPPSAAPTSRGPPSL